MMVVAARAWSPFGSWSFEPVDSLKRRLVCEVPVGGGLRFVASGRSSVRLAREASAAFGLALPGFASRPATGCGLAQQRCGPGSRV